jgi:serine/threonine protein kinase
LRNLLLLFGVLRRKLAARYVDSATLCHQLTTAQGHDGVIRLIGKEEDAFSVYLIMERCECDLLEVVSSGDACFRNEDISKWMRQTLSGVLSLSARQFLGSYPTCSLNFHGFL